MLFPQVCYCRRTGTAHLRGEKEWEWINPGNDGGGVLDCYQQRLIVFNRGMWDTPPIHQIPVFWSPGFQLSLLNRVQYINIFMHKYFFIIAASALIPLEIWLLLGNGRHTKGPGRFGEISEAESSVCGPMKKLLSNTKIICIFMHLPTLPHQDSWNHIHIIRAPYLFLKQLNLKPAVQNNKNKKLSPPLKAPNW